jgi:hypothetical protein
MKKAEKLLRLKAFLYFGFVDTKRNISSWKNIRIGCGIFKRMEFKLGMCNVVGKKITMA